MSSTGNPDSWLVKNTDAFLFAGIKAEGSSLNRAPRNSVLGHSDKILIADGNYPLAPKLDGIDFLAQSAIFKKHSFQLEAVLFAIQLQEKVQSGSVFK